MKIFINAIIIIGTCLLCPCKAQDIPLKSEFKLPKNPQAILKSKGFTIGPNFAYLMTTKGWGVEYGFPITRRQRNIAVFLGYNQWSQFHPKEGDVKDLDCWDVNTKTFSFGLRYFPGLKPFRGFYTGELINITKADIFEPNSGTSGNFQQVGLILEIGARVVFFRYFFIQGSCGFGGNLSKEINLNPTNNDIDNPRLWTPFYVSTIVGVYF